MVDRSKRPKPDALFSAFDEQRGSRQVRPELAALLRTSEPIVMVTGDSGTGKSSLLAEHQREQSSSGHLSPVPVTCAFDNGALQLAILDSLSLAIVDAAGNEGRWKTLKRRLDNASTEMAAEIGKSMAKAVTQELTALVKARLGEHVGEGIAGFIKGLGTDSLDSVRQDIRRRSDASIVRMLTRLCDEVAIVFDQTVIIALDEVQRLTDEDHRIIASLSDHPPARARMVLAWSLADVAADSGLHRILTTGCPEIEVGGLDAADVARWVGRARLPETVTPEIMRLSSGFPLVVEGIVNQLSHGGSIEQYTPPSAFSRSVDDALRRLDPDTDYAVRLLSAFVDPPQEATIITFLSTSPLVWGRIRTRLEHEHLLTVNRDGRLWFHELRRRHLWDHVLSDAERNSAGQQAFSTLVEQSLLAAYTQPSNLIPIARLARFATDSRGTDPRLDVVLGLSTPELAVLAALIEVELDRGGYRYSTPEQALIYAHRAFGADRGDALSALPALVVKNMVRVLSESAHGNRDHDVRAEIGVDFTDPCTLVLHGRIHRSLGRGVIPSVTTTIVRDHFEQFRLESTFVVSTVGDADPLELLNQVASPPYRRPILLGRVPNPALGVWVDYGGNTLCLAATFNNEQDCETARHIATAVTGATFGLPIRVRRIFADPTRVLPTLRFIRSIHLVTDSQIEVWKSGDCQLITDHELPLQEHVQREVDLLKIVRSHCDSLERDVYNLDSDPGFAFAQRENSLYYVELRHSGRAFELDDAAIAILTDDQPFRFARLEHALPLRTGETTKRIDGLTRTTPRLIDDPVVSRVGKLGLLGRKFNERQPRRTIRLTADDLTAALMEANIRDWTLATALGHQLTIAGRRGSIETRALRAVVHPGIPLKLPPTIVYTEPLGQPADVEVIVLDGDSIPSNAEDMYHNAFPDMPTQALAGGALTEELPLLLGHHPDEIQFRIR